MESRLGVAPGLPFEIEYIELTESFHRFEICGYILEAFRVKHTVPCYGYSQIIQRAGRFDSEKAKANHVPMKVWSSLQKGKTVDWEGKTYTPDMVLGPPRKGIKLTYTTDTRPTESILRNAEVTKRHMLVAFCLFDLVIFTVHSLTDKKIGTFCIT